MNRYINIFLKRIIEIDSLRSTSIILTFNYLKYIYILTILSNILFSENFIMHGLKKLPFDYFNEKDL